MIRQPARLVDTMFDVVVIGGGITGACVAHDAALRGLSVALVEQGDFGGATSSASSKLLHGGIRYLQQGRVDKIRESAIERACFHRIAPHLMHWVPFLVPTQRSVLRGELALRSAMWLYQGITRGADRTVLDPSKRMPSARFYSGSELSRLVPALGKRDDVTGAQLLYESHLHSSERMTLAFLKTAVSSGAVVANYTAAHGVLQRRSRVEGVTVIDRLNGERFDVRGRLVVNAAGPWVVALNQRLKVGRLAAPVRGFSRGAHLVTRPVSDHFALALPTSRRASTLLDRGGRHLFVIPWRGRSLIGTSDRPHVGSLDVIEPTEDDIADLLGDVNKALPGVALTRGDVLHAFAGLYPLTAHAVSAEVYQGTGDYQIIDHGGAGGMEGVISVLGAKYTTARRVAERAVTAICQRLGRPTSRCRTRDEPLVGGAIQDLERFTTDAVRRLAGSLAPATAEHLVRHYGTEIDAVVTAGTGGEDKDLLTPLAPDRETTGAEVLFAVEEEMAVTLEDVVFRRTGLGTIGKPGGDCLQRCTALMASSLRWSRARMDEELRGIEARFSVGES